MSNAKQLIFLLILSIIAVMGAHYLSVALKWLVVAHGDIIHVFHQVFSANNVGNILSALLALIVVPAIITLVVAGVYWCFKRKLIPNLWIYVWGVWLILATVLISQG